MKKLAIYAENVKEIDLHNVKIEGYGGRTPVLLQMSAILRRTDTMTHEEIPICWAITWTT